MSYYKDPTSANMTEWPYPVNYGKENDVNTDVLIIGGGIAGCHAAIHSARKGAKVVIVEKGATVRSGAGGAGVDHWHDAFTNPFNYWLRSPNAPTYKENYKNHCGL